MSGEMLENQMAPDVEHEMDAGLLQALLRVYQGFRVYGLGFRDCSPRASRTWQCLCGGYQEDIGSHLRKY